MMRTRKFVAYLLVAFSVLSVSTAAGAPKTLKQLMLEDLQAAWSHRIGVAKQRQTQSTSTAATPPTPTAAPAREAVQSDSSSASTSSSSDIDFADVGLTGGGGYSRIFSGGSASAAVGVGVGVGAICLASMAALIGVVLKVRRRKEANSLERQKTLGGTL
ncbi:hypothetical protein BOX15_Mlig008747g3 [Macrostomum lignano]|uniref:Transmembrane protein n=2 Tax=Macrostomum lignano TaxID=282301 RepID=A0A1I8IIX0_9PLAT|nr:hypothetical protein BOX15_Mlig008747g3 [Macrostomum lignano]